MQSQGMLSDKYLDQVPDGSRAAKSGTALSRKLLTEENLFNIKSLNEIANGRGQSLAQMALAWNLYHPQVTSVLIGVSNIEQIEQNVEALKNLKSVMKMGKEKSDVPLPENETVTPKDVVRLRNKLKKNQVREGKWV